jgi:hypothetical protein
MYQTISFRFMVTASKIGKDGSAPLMLSIIVNKKRVSIQLKKKLKPSEFNNSSQLSNARFLPGSSMPNCSFRTSMAALC